MLTDGVIGELGSDVAHLPRAASNASGKKAGMPEDPFEAAQWLLSRLLQDVSNAKTYPLKLNHLKHQGALCTSFENHAVELEQSFMQLKGMIRQGQDAVFPDQMSAAVRLALDRQSMFYEDKDAADGLCRPKKEKKNKKDDDEEDA
ncbi:unnamed protein product [Cladocopium goreaui]|uniref:GAR domain-containing protein n=1 Tax=Cladocopium goreaui TaxID=2562237 RepID=A0A9P1DTP4_9DINO|nr:unnamed protein product [Cladocopium goreaui]